MRLARMAILVAVLTGCSVPVEVRRSIENQADDFAVMERELLPLIPAEATAKFGDHEKPAREGWFARIRVMRLRSEGLLAWVKDEEFDWKKRLTELLSTP